jgi:hypothetical protein
MKKVLAVTPEGLSNIVFDELLYHVEGEFIRRVIQDVRYGMTDVYEISNSVYRGVRHYGIST